MNAEETRKFVELRRRARIHAQIAALRARFIELGKPSYANRWLQRIKISKKIERLEGELKQDMLLPVHKPREWNGAVPAERGGTRRSG